MKATKKKYVLFLIINIIFVVDFILLYFISSYSKQIATMPDEILYYSIANSLIHGHGIEVYNISNSFQKILYSIVISPAFLATNHLLRIQLIALINSIVVCSGIFPTYLLAKRLLNSNKAIISVCIFFCVFSDLAYALSFMSEVLFLPMGLWAVYLTNKVFISTTNLVDSNTKTVLSVKYMIGVFLLGVYFFLVYMCKEVGAVFPVAFVLCWLVYFAREFILHNLDKNKVILLIAQLAAMCLGFFAIMDILKLTVFTAKDVTYNIADTSVYSELFNIYYVNYGMVYFIGMTIFAYGIFPIVYPLLNWKKLEKKDLNFLLYINMLLIISAFVVSYKITATENWGQTVPRIHLRYICYLFIPYVIVMLNTFEHDSKVELKKLLITISGFAAWYLLIAFTSFQTIVSYEDFVDHTMLQYMFQNMDYQMVILCIYLVLMFVISVLLFKR